MWSGYESGLTPPLQPELAIVQAQPGFRSRREWYMGDSIQIYVGTYLSGGTGAISGDYTFDINTGALLGATYPGLSFSGGKFQ